MSIRLAKLHENLHMASEMSETISNGIALAKRGRIRLKGGRLQRAPLGARHTPQGMGVDI